MNLNSAYIHLLGCSLTLMMSITPSLNQTPAPSFSYNFDHSIDDRWVGDFEMVDNYSHWTNQNDRIEYHASNASLGSIHISTEELKQYDKAGTLTLKVQTGLCKPKSQVHADSYWGFSITNPKSDNKILAVVDGSGKTKILDPAHQEPDITQDVQKGSLQGVERVQLELEVWNSPEGKLIFFSAYDADDHTLISKNEISIPANVLDGDLDIALIANIQDVQSTGVWFDDWEIFKDWVPFN